MTNVPNSILRSTCAVLDNGRIVGTAWLVSSEGFLITAGHLLGEENHVDSVDIQFSNDIPRKASCIRWGVIRDMGIDFAVLRIASEHIPQVAAPIPIALPHSVSGDFCLVGYGVTLESLSTGSGTFAGYLDVQNSVEHRLFQLETGSSGEAGYSGAAVYSHELGAAVAIQIEAVDKRSGTHSNTVLAMPLFRISSSFEVLSKLALPNHQIPDTTIISPDGIQHAIEHARHDLTRILQTANATILEMKIDDLLEQNRREKKSNQIPEDKIRQTTLDNDRLVDIDVDFSNVLTANTLRTHVAELRSWAHTVSFRDMKEAKQTHQIYIELNTYVMPLRTHLAETERLSVKPIESAITESARHCVVLGQPGAGKTTSMKKLLINYFMPDSSIGQYGFPLLIKFRDLSLAADEHAALGNELRRLLGFHFVLPSQLSETARKRAEQILNTEISFAMINELKPFIVLDGFDEIPTHEQKANMLVELRELAIKLTKAKFVLTCRSGEFNYHLEHTDTFELSPLSMTQVKEFARKWIKDEDKSARFVEDIENSPFADTVIKPLSLAHLCAIYERIGSIPDRPKTVYRKVVALMIDEWDGQRSVVRKSKYSMFESDRKFEFLCHLAFHLTTQNLTVFSQSQLEAAYLGIHNNFGLPQDQSVETANELESHTGLFLQSGFQKYEFAHKSLQEFLTAEYIVKLPSLIRLGRSMLESLGAELAIATSISSNPSIYFADIVLGVFNKANLSTSFYDAFVSRLLLERPDFYPSDDVVLAVVSLLNSKPHDEKLRALAVDVFAKNSGSVLRKYYTIDDLSKFDFVRFTRRSDHPEYELRDVMQIAKVLFTDGMLNVDAV